MFENSIEDIGLVMNGKPNGGFVQLVVAENGVMILNLYQIYKKGYDVMELIFMQQIINEIYITFTEIFKKELEK